MSHFNFAVGEENGFLPVCPENSYLSPACLGASAVRISGENHESILQARGQMLSSLLGGPCSYALAKTVGAGLVPNPVHFVGYFGGDFTLCCP